MPKLHVPLKREGLDARRLRDQVVVALDILFATTAIVQGVAKRVDDGIASSAQAVEYGWQTRPPAELGWQFAQRVGA